jgi:hypothetical protein
MVYAGEGGGDLAVCVSGGTKLGISLQSMDLRPDCAKRASPPQASHDAKACAS